MRTVATALFFWTFFLTPVLTAQTKAARGGGVYLGVTLEQAGTGLLITEVVPASPAAKAGLKARDVIVKMNGNAVAALDPFIDDILAKKAGDRIRLVIRRGADQQHNVSIILGRRSGGATAKPRVGKAAGRQGARADALDQKGKGVLGVELEQDGDSITIVNVTKGGPAAKAGLRTGDRILGANGKRIDDIDKLVESIVKAGAGSRYSLKIRRGTRELNLVARLGGVGATDGKPSEIVAKKAPRPRTEQAAAKWSAEFTKAQALARRTGKPLVIDFFADWCRPCVMLEKSFASPAVKSILANCVLVRVDVDKSEKLADSYGVSSIPHVVVLGAGTKALGKFTGYLPAAALAKKLGGYLEGVTKRDVASGRNRDNRRNRGNRDNSDNASNRLRRLLQENERKSTVLEEIQRLETERSKLSRRISELLKQLQGKN